MPMTRQIAAARDGARRQIALADIAETDEVRAVHRALEQLYRTQLVAMELSARLGADAIER